MAPEVVRTRSLTGPADSRDGLEQVYGHPQVKKERAGAG